MKITEAIKKDLETLLKSQKFEQEVTDPSADELKKKIKSQSLKGYDAFGDRFQRLQSDDYKRSRRRYSLPVKSDLHYKSRGGGGESKGAFSEGVFDYDVFGNEAHFNFSGQTHMKRYMDAHQKGRAINGRKMPVREWFPDSKIQEDGGTTAKKIKREVQSRLTRVLNSDRLIVVNG